jgi:hypothetical protein
VFIILLVFFKRYQKVPGESEGIQKISELILGYAKVFRKNMEFSWKHQKVWKMLKCSVKCSEYFRK